MRHAGHRSLYAHDRPKRLSASGVVRSFGTNSRTAESALQEEEGEQPLQLEDDGEYEIIVPKDPFARPMFPPPLRVPPHISRPPYATPESLEKQSKAGYFAEAYTGDGRIVLGSEDEAKLRRAAGLARRILNYAGTLAVVSISGLTALVHTDCCSQVCQHKRLTRRSMTS